MVELSVDKVWGDAWKVYKLLFRRSIATAALIYALIEGVDVLGEALDRRWASILFGVLSFVLFLAGPSLVQGALVEIVRNVHEGRSPKRIEGLYRTAFRRLHSLVWASLVYSFGISFGLLLLIVPGLKAAARWSLMPPLIVLEDEDAGGARRRSSTLVTPFTWPVVGVVVATFFVTWVPITVAVIALDQPDISLLTVWLAKVLLQSVTAPFGAHVRTVLYYRLIEPDQPVIHPDVRTWRSVWAGA